jgi:signal recognition particle subunit SRP54
VQDVNRLLKQHRQMADMVKSMSRSGGKGMAGMMAAMGMGGGAGGLPPGITPPGGGLGKMGGGLGGMGGLGGPDLDKLRALGGGKLPGAPGGLPGMGQGFPGLPGLPKKK